MEQAFRYPVPNGCRLTGYPSTPYGNEGIILTKSLRDPERLLNECRVRFEWEIELKWPPIHCNLAITGQQPYACNGRFPFARVIVPSTFCHPSSRPGVHYGSEKRETPFHITPKTPEAQAAAPRADACRPYRFLTYGTSPAPAWSSVTSRGQHILQCAPAGVGALCLR